MTEQRRVDLGAVDLYGMIEQLVRNQPQQSPDAAPSGAGVASNRDALEAVAQLAAAIEKPAETGDLDPEEAHRMASLLLVVRDYVEPLPSDVDGRVSRYLTEVVDKLRR